MIYGRARSIIHDTKIKHDDAHDGLRFYLRARYKEGRCRRARRHIHAECRHATDGYITAARPAFYKRMRWRCTASIPSTSSTAFRRWLASRDRRLFYTSRWLFCRFRTKLHDVTSFAARRTEASSLLHRCRICLPRHQYRRNRQYRGLNTTKHRQRDRPRYV